MKLQNKNSDFYEFFVWVRNFFSYELGVNFSKRGNAIKNANRLERWAECLTGEELDFVIAFLDDDSSLFDEEAGADSYHSLLDFSKRFLRNSRVKVDYLRIHLGLGGNSVAGLEVCAIILISNMLYDVDDIDLHSLVEMYKSEMY